MSIVTIDDSCFTNIANAIRGKNGETTTYKPNEMAAAISALSSGGSGDWQVAAISTVYDATTNKTIIPLTNYIDVNTDDFLLFAAGKYSQTSSDPYWVFMISPMIVKLYNAFYNNSNGNFSPALPNQAIGLTSGVATEGRTRTMNYNARFTDYISRPSLFYSADVSIENGDFVVTGFSGITGSRMGYWAFIVYREG